MKKQHEHKIDELFNKAFEDFKSEPSEQSWENIRRQTPPSSGFADSGKGFHLGKFMYWFIPSLVIVTVAALYWYSETRSKIITDADHHKNEIVMNDSHPASTINTVHENSENNSTSTSTSTSSSVHNEKNLQTNVIEKNQQAAKTAGNTGIYAQTNASSNSLPEKKSTEDITQYGKQTGQTFAEDKTDSRPDNEKNDQNKWNTSSMNTGTVEEHKAETGTAGMYGNIEDPKEQSLKDKFFMLPVLAAKYLLSQETQNINSAALNKFSSEIADKPVPAHPRIYAGIHYTPEVLFNMPEKVTMTKKNSFIQGGQLSINYDIRNITFQSGLNFSMYNNKASNEINYVSRDSIGSYLDVVSYNVIQGDSGQQIIYQTQVQNIYDSVNHSEYDLSKNSYSYFQIPFMLGYKGYVRKFSFTVRAGLGFGVLVYKKETPYAFSMDDATLISIVNTTPTLTKTNTQFLFNVGIGYQLSDNITIAVEPSFKYYLNPLYENSTEHPYSIGLRTGLYFKF
jgi:hypothetical protein